MDTNYDWQIAFKDKTDEELYRIYKGQSLLPDYAIKFAKDELDRRNFDFDDMDQDKLSWRISQLIEDIQFSEYRIKNGARHFVSFKDYLIILVCSLLFSIFLLYMGLDLLESIAIFSLTVVLISISVLLNNYTHIRVLIKQSCRIEELNKLINQIEKYDKKISKYPQIEELENRIDIELRIRKKIIFVAITFLIIFLLFMKNLKV